jgi:hypothetical protein
VIRLHLIDKPLCWYKRHKFVFKLVKTEKNLSLLFILEKMSLLHTVLLVLLLTSINGVPTTETCSNGRQPLTHARCKSNGEGCPADTYCQFNILRCCAIIWPTFNGSFGNNNINVGGGQ